MVPQRKSNLQTDAAQPGDGLMKVGSYMFAFCILFLIVGRTVVSIFFPDLKGKGIPPGMWFVLIPVWSVGVIGLALLLAGWIRSKVA